MIAQFAQAAKIDPAVVAAFIAKAGLRDRGGIR